MANSNISFKDTKIAFKSKGNSDMNHSFWIFKLLENTSLVKLFSNLTLFSIRLGLPITGPIKATIFKQFCGGESIEETVKVVTRLNRSNVGSILDYSVEGKESEDDFAKTKNEVLNIIQLAKENPAIPYTSLKITGIARFALLEKLSTKQPLDKEEEKEVQALKERLSEIGNYAHQSNVPIYIDAEESWIQDGIDLLVEQMMEEFNTQKPIILTTLQMYRWDRLDYLNRLIIKSRIMSFFIGIKLVRGAYIEKENARALEKGYRSPMQTCKENTDRDFDKAVDICMENIDRITFCAGTHNEASTLHLINKMKELNIPNNHPNVYFSQLYGMSDHITYNLADAGYNVTKYLPYGPVKSVVPYLIRRAEENTAIAGQMSRELRLIIEEKRRRQNERLLIARK